MRNITVAINDKVYHDVRVWSAQRDLRLRSGSAFS